MAMQVGQLFWFLWRGMRRISMREALCGGFDRVCLPMRAPAQHLVACVAAIHVLGTEHAQECIVARTTKNKA